MVRNFLSIHKAMAETHDEKNTLRHCPGMPGTGTTIDIGMWQSSAFIVIIEVCSEQWL